MKDSRSPLTYASPHGAPRPPMFNMVLGILVAGFLIGMGSVCGACFVAGLWIAATRTDALVPLLIAVGMLPFSVAFLAVGILVMLRTIGSLRGTPPRGTRWERWAAMIDQPWRRA